MTGRIVVTGVQASGRHGVAPFERERPTELLVDAELDIDIARAASSDSLDDTIDYTEVIREIRRITADSSFALLERLASTIGDRLVELGATRAVVRIAKPAVAASLEAAGVTVEVSR
ncbi:MAG TPA: dihydroneopterin aldolase [Actinomycetota bacterium]|nr:dihydroneopterin aldolase [Actinomycetota bacterium]